MKKAKTCGQAARKVAQVQTGCSHAAERERGRAEGCIACVILLWSAWHNATMKTARCEQRLESPDPAEKEAAADADARSNVMRSVVWRRAPLAEKRWLRTEMDTRGRLAGVRVNVGVGCTSVPAAAGGSIVANGFAVAAGAGVFAGRLACRMTFQRALSVSLRTRSPFWRTPELTFACWASKWGEDDTGAGAGRQTLKTGSGEMWLMGWMLCCKAGQDVCSGCRKIQRCMLRQQCQAHGAVCKICDANVANGGPIGNDHTKIPPPAYDTSDEIASRHPF